MNQQIQIEESTGSKSYLKAQEQFLCACGRKLKCEGICSETHLFRSRQSKTLLRCPAAYKN